MDLKKAQKHIRNAWIAGVVSGTVSLYISLVRSIAANLFPLPIDGLIFFGLSFGIYKRSRICAIAMLIVFIFEKLTQDSLTEPKIVYIPVVLVFLYFYSQGVRGALVYHKLTKNEQES